MKGAGAGAVYGDGRGHDDSRSRSRCCCWVQASMPLQMDAKRASADVSVWW